MRVLSVCSLKLMPSVRFEVGTYSLINQNGAGREPHYGRHFGLLQESRNTHQSDDRVHNIGENNAGNHEKPGAQSSLQDL